MITVYILFSAAEWKLDEPDWTGRLKVSAKGHDLRIKLEDRNTGINECIQTRLLLDRHRSVVNFLRKIYRQCVTSYVETWNKKCGLQS